MEGKIVSGGTDLLLDRGLTGLVILALAFVCWRLFKMYVEVMEKRIGEARLTAQALEESTRATDALADLIRDRLGRV